VPFYIVRGDITKFRADAIVNAANVSLRMGGGVCGAIFAAAGAEELQAACDRLAPIKTGKAVVTSGFGLPAKYIIHTAGPIYRGGDHGEEALLRSCYASSLKLAAEHECGSVAFPLISSGIYGYPKYLALRAATDAIRAFLRKHDADVYLVMFGDEALAIDRELLEAVENHLSGRYPPEGRDFVCESDALILKSGFDELTGGLGEPFSATLLKLIDAAGKKDSYFYNRANIERRLFSKIRGSADYAPSVTTALAFAVALELTLEQTEDLLGRAGLTLSRSRKFDAIVEYFIQNGVYDIYKINEVLFYYGQPLLGGV